MADAPQRVPIEPRSLETARLYVGNKDEALDVYQTRAGLIAVSTVADATKPGANEDSAVVVPVGPDHLVLVVADGVGGMAQARKASNITVNAIRDALKKVVEFNGRRLRAAILDGIESANRSVLDLGSGAASTLALAEIGPESVRTYHVGDSALMMCSQRGSVRFQTTPHSPVGFAMEAGLIDETEALQHAELNLIFNVIGSTDMRIEIGSETPIASKDTLLIASDGLLDNVLQEEIIDRIRIGPIDEAAHALTNLAVGRMRDPQDNQPSKPDDFTVILFRRNGNGKSAES